MTTYFTGNPLGSQDPRDLFDNSGNLDQFMLSQERTYPDRLGADRLTLKALEEATPDAIAARDDAALARDNTYQARDIALAAAGPLYVSEAEGRAAVVDGKTFNVQGTGVVAAYQYRRISATQSSLIATFPATAFVDATAVAAREPGGALSEFYGGTSQPYASIPLADEAGNPLIGVEEDGRTHILQQARFAEFHNDDHDLSAAIMGDEGVLLIGWNAAGNPEVPGLAPVSESAANLLPYLQGSQLHAVGGQDVVAADLGMFNALTVHAVSPKHVAAVIDRPSLGAKTAVAAAEGLVVPYSDKVLHVVIGLGQSLIVGAESSGTLISTTPEFPQYVLMFDRGDSTSDVRMGLVTSIGAAALNPADLIGFTPLFAKTGQGASSRGQTPMESFSNGLTRDAAGIGVGYRSLSFTAGLGGAGYSVIKKGTQIYNDMLAALNRAKLLAEAQGWSIIVDGCLVKHGEADSTSTNYLSFLLEWQTDVDADVKAITGQQAPVHFFLAQPSSFTTTTPRAVQSMLDAHNTSPYHHLVGADYPFLSEYVADYVHFKGSGYYLIGEGFERGWKQTLWAAASKSKIVQMTQATRSGTEVTVKYSVPKPPLVFDTTTITERDVKGFVFRDSTGPIAISAAVITDNGNVSGIGEIKLTLASVPSGSGEVVSYAMSPKLGTDVPRGNVRDSDTLRSTYDNRNLYNWAVHQSISL